MKYPDSYLAVGNEIEVDFTPGILKMADAKKFTSKETNNLPDSDFAYISPGGTKDSEGKTTPRSLRHLPIPDAAHVRNALARLNQTDIPPAAKKEALSKIKSKAKDLGVEVSKSDGGIKDGEADYPDAKDSSSAETKKQWDKTDKKELKRDTKKEEEEHEEDAIKDDKSKIKKLKKGSPSEKKSVEIHDIKKDEKIDKKNKKADAAEFPEVAFKPAPFDGVLESAPYSKLLEPVDWDKLKKELNLNNLWFKKPKAPKADYRKFLDPNYTP